MIQPWSIAHAGREAMGRMFLTKVPGRKKQQKICMDLIYICVCVCIFLRSQTKGAKNSLALGLRGCWWVSCLVRRLWAWKQRAQPRTRVML